MNKYVFISGLHRSGTSILHKVIGTSPMVSIFDNTGVPKDEGQHVQSVYKPAKYYGGPGLFAFSNDARLDEHSELINYKNKDQLYEEWGRYWDKSKPVLIEKSPPNLIRTRFLQELFPKAYFITIIRHPIAVSYATKKWSKTSMDRLIKHWICAHTIYLEDRSNLSNEIFFSYEHMIHSPENVIRSIEKFIDIKIPYKSQFTNQNNQYFKKWKSIFFLQQNRYHEKNQIIEDYESIINNFGYSLVELSKYPDRISCKP